jgi:BirA family biotin operon repressor/biotin-[acetyl-CoA-carboxylase] ligase
MLVDELRQGLTTSIFGKQIHYFATVGSTNTEAKTFAQRGAGEGTIVFADDQTAGRGRFGRTWISEPGKNLLFSIILRPAIESSKAGLLSLFAAVAITKAIETFTGISCECKWPNDILIHKKKCCGILLESALQGNKLEYAILGIGINVNQMTFSKELAGTSTSLALECKTSLDRIGLCQNILISLESYYNQYCTEGFEKVVHIWKTHSSMFGKSIRFRQQEAELEGTAVDLSNQGGLIVRSLHETFTIHAGDITILSHA